MGKVEVLHNRGYPITSAEEEFRIKLENLNRDLNQPNQFKGKINSLLSLVKMHV